MILLFSGFTDSVVGFLVNRLLKANARFLVLDSRQHGTGYRLSWGGAADDVADGFLQVGPQKWRLRDVRSAFVHAWRLPQPAGAGSEEQSPGRVPQTEWLLNTFLETAPILVVNRPSASITNLSKPYQQQRIARAGFRVPQTLLTTCPEEARDFYEKCRRRVIFKSVSARRSIVVRMASTDLERLEQVRTCPTQFQEWIPGVDVRVHVIGRRLFATEICTDAVDYRYAGRFGHNRAMRATQLPPAVAERCLALTTELGLATAGIDLRRTPDGEYYCFEANPTPGYTFYQQYTGQRIGEALVDLLVRPEAS
jgi:hypothetical protein